ncbi:MAG TPA: radical SAM protein [Stellaceae bacterium]|nr:radical SAM protein [Stellaceae bacterium]
MTVRQPLETPQRARRMRAAHPLVDPDGFCRLIYDLERTFIIEVPPEFQARLASGVDTTTCDSSLGDWLIAKDLLTHEPHYGWGQGELPPVPNLTDLSLDLSGNCNMGCTYCFEDAIGSRIGPMSDATATAAVDFAFAKAANAARISLHFGSGEPLIRFDLLRKIVSAANKRAAATKKAIVYDLTTNATLVTDEIATFLRDNPFSVRVSCDGPAALHDQFRPMRGGQASYPAVERGLRLLLKHMPDRVTVNSVICGGTRLAEVWTWARGLDIRHFHVIKVGADGTRDINLRHTELSAFRADLQAICNEMAADLRAGRRPVDFQPITKVIRRLMIPEPITRFCGVAGSYLGVASNGQVYPCFRHLGLEAYHLGDVWQGVDDGKRQSFLGTEAADVDSRPVCRACWARYLCGGGCYADSVVYGPDKRKPQEQHCPFWRLEIEAAIRFFDQLRREDPVLCLRLFGDSIEGAISKPAKSETLGFLQKRNCQ